MSVAVVTVTWNNVGEIEAFLDSARKSDPAEIWVIDNGSTDGTVELLRACPDIHLIETGVNVGFGTAMNLGIARSTAEFVALCNPDLVLAPDALSLLADKLRRAPQLGAVSPIVTTPHSGKPYPLLRTDTNLTYGWNHFSGILSRFPESRWVRRQVEIDPIETATAYPWLHGCCGMYRRAALAHVGGGFDERFFLYFEDADLGRCLRQAGWGLEVVPEARVEHGEGKSAAQAPQATRIHFMESWHLYQRKHCSWTYRQLAFFVVLCALLLQVLFQGVKAVCQRSHLLGSMICYLFTHVSAPFRNLEREREMALFDARTRWQVAESSTPATQRSPSAVIA